jgi:hypothetical protein
MPARFVVHTRLEPNLDAALSQLGESIQRRTIRRRRKEAGLAQRPSELPYLRNAEEIEAARIIEAKKFPERDFPDPPAPAPYVSPEDELTERLKKVVFTNLSNAEQLTLFAEAAE